LPTNAKPISLQFLNSDKARTVRLKNRFLVAIILNVRLATSEEKDKIWVWGYESRSVKFDRTIDVMCLNSDAGNNGGLILLKTGDNANQVLSCPWARDNKNGYGPGCIQPYSY
jgi:hypothetical protein